MPEVDLEMLNKAQKGLTVGFIICICIVNILLIIKTTCKKGFVYGSPKNLTIISLALGDMFLALYCLVIMAKTLFENETYGCRFVISMLIYSYWVINFVYGAGLIVLAVELMFRLKQRFLISNKALVILKALVCSVIPWILGLAVVLPLTLVGINWETCQQETTRDRELAKHYVSVIIPAGLAVIICVIVSCIPSTPREVIYVQNPQITDVSINTTNSSTGFSGSGTYAYPYQTDKTGVWNNSFVNTPPPATLTTPQQVTGEQRVFVPVPDYQEPITVDAGREKIVLVITSIVFCFCVVPYPAFNIYIFLASGKIKLSVFAYTILVQSFYWLSIFRSLITPLIWLGCSGRY